MNPLFPILCTVFMNVSGKSLENLLNNVKAAGKRCSWAIVGYDDSSPALNQKLIVDAIVQSGSKLEYYQIENDTSLYNSYMKDRGIAKRYESMTYTYINESDPQSKSIKFLHIPKPLLYLRVQHLLPQFSKVWLLDEDISLKNFDFETYMYIIECGNKNPPMISQPLLADNSQYFKYLNVRSWKGAMVFAVPTSYVEQQTPLLNTLFFNWFLENVVKPLSPLAFLLGSDWSFDDMWCRAGTHFAKVVYNYSTPNYSACLLVTKGTPIHHLNLRSLQFLHLDRKGFGAIGDRLRNMTAKVFPNWLVKGAFADTLHPKDRRQTRKQAVWKLPRSCVSSDLSTLHIPSSLK